MFLFSVLHLDSRGFIHSQTQFAVLLAVIFIVELAVGIAACLFKADLQDHLNDSLERSIGRSDPDDLYAWDNVQRKLNCCGISGPADWADLSRDHVIRPSCCRPEQINQSSNDCSNSAALYKDRYYQDGCLSKLKQRVGSKTSLLVVVGLGFAFLQILGIVLACWLASSIRREAH